MSEPTKLPKKQVDEVCKKGLAHPGSKGCSFLALGNDGLVCLKGSHLEAGVRRRRKEGLMTSKGDNCSGPPKFETT
jgi:hypothetical protein